MIKNDLDSTFIDRVIWTSLWVTAIVCLFFLAYRQHVPTKFCWGFLIGSVTSMGNLLFLKMIITSFIRPDDAKWLNGLIGVVGIHAVLAGFLYSVWLKTFSFAALLLGFSMCLIIAFLKAVSLAIAQNMLDKSKES